MKTIDSLLHLATSQGVTSKSPFSLRDIKTLHSLYNAMQSDTYITEKQGNLLVTILNTPAYSQVLLGLISDYKEYLDNPQWSKSWRVIPEIKKIFHIPAGSNLVPAFSHIRNDNYSGYIGIDFTFSSALRKVLNSHSEIYQIKSGSFYIADLTEKNLVFVIDLLSEYKFDVDPLLKSYYDIITAWDKQAVTDQYLISNIIFPKFQAAILSDIGETTSLDSVIINDRSLRYRYTNHVNTDNSTLTNIIASRKKPKIWIDSNAYSLNTVIASLVELQRLPLLVVFEQSTDFTTITQFNELAQALTNHGITDNIGFHFRLDNTPDGKIFNDAIGKRQYNSVLNDDTKVAAVLGGKLPKFFLKEKWRPMSVLCIRNTLRHSKTAVYANSSDLIISYTHVEPIIETRNTWE